MSKNILGFVLIDAPHSALNNAGQDVGQKTENAVVVKVIKRGRKIYPYVSAQAWRYWWRMTLAEKFGWKLSPVIRETKIAFTSANPFEFPDDDVFGYMRAMKKNEGGTLTRLSPLKCSPLVSVVEQPPTDDFGVMSRHEGDPVPFEHQFYSTVFKGIFSLDLFSVGTFHELEKTGYKNLDVKYVEKDAIKNSIGKTRASKENGVWKLPRTERAKRAKETVEALTYIYTTTKAAGHLTDVTPKFIILVVIDGGNHIFMNITNHDDEKPIVNLNALKQVIGDYRDVIISDVYIGRSEGFMDDLAGEFSQFKTDKTIHFSSVKKAVEDFAQIIDRFIN
jgi:CRISPR-associated protein Cst2